jgi:lysophospholipase L1-like esterase
VYRALPNGRDEIVFAGDSFTASAPLLDAYTTLRNRGIGGDTTAGLLSRLDEIIEARPERVFLQVGANDVANLVPVGETVENYRTILRRIRGDSPHTLVFAMSVPPTDPELLESAARRNPVIGKLNAELRRLAATEGVTFIDLTPWLEDGQGNLRRDFTAPDGIHLNTAGQLVVCDLLRPYVPTHQAIKAQKP